MKLPLSLGLFTCLLLFSTSCETGKKEAPKSQPVAIKTAKPRPIDIYPYQGFPAELAKSWQQRLAKYNPEVRIMPVLDLPGYDLPDARCRREEYV